MEKQLKSFLKELKSNESSISMLLGGLVMIVTSVLIISYFRSVPKPQITQESSSTTSAAIAQKDVKDIDTNAIIVIITFRIYPPPNPLQYAQEY